MAVGQRRDVLPFPDESEDKKTKQQRTEHGSVNHRDEEGMEGRRTGCYPSVLWTVSGPGKPVELREVIMEGRRGSSPTWRVS